MRFFINHEISNIFYILVLTKILILIDLFFMQKLNLVKLFFHQLNQYNKKQKAIVVSFVLLIQD
jgi:hypothetical protein